MNYLGTREGRPDPRSEKERILEANKVEEEWYENHPAFATGEDIDKAIEKGDLVEVPNRTFWYRDQDGRVEDTNNSQEKKSGEYQGGYVLSENIKGDYGKALSPEGLAMLETICVDWADKMKDKGHKLNPEKTFLFVTSVTRSLERQKSLSENEGRPAADADKSTHTKGGAIDISAQYFGGARNKFAGLKRRLLGGYEKDGAESLQNTLVDLQEKGKIHYMNEGEQKLFHVGVKPAVRKSMAQERQSQKEAVEVS